MRLTREERAAWVARGFVDPLKRYHQHAAHAGERGIEFELTFEEWWAIWEPRYAERGPRRGQFVMCRQRDTGPYAADNVRIDTVSGNAGEAKQVRRFERQGNTDAGWLYAPFRRSMGYFQLRELMERRAELGLDEDDEEETT